LNAGWAAALCLAALLGVGCRSTGPGAPATPTRVGAPASAPGLRASLTAPAGAPHEGVNTLDLYLTDEVGQPIQAAAVTFDLDMTNMSMGLYQLEASAGQAGHYAAPVTFSMPGPWRLVALIDRPGQPQAQVRFDFDVAVQ
jgi:hypothetical protein